MLIGSRQRITKDSIYLLKESHLERYIAANVYSLVSVAELVAELLTWDSHVSSFDKKVLSAIAVIRKVKPFVPASALINFNHSIVEPHFDYCSIMWDDISDHLTGRPSKDCKIALHV